MTVKEIQAEREHQQRRFDTSNDDAWTPGEWAALIAHFSTRHVVGDLKKIDIALFRSDMVKVGALALACVESIDRKGGV